MTRAITLSLTLLTGFSGLVYEVAWQRYLATLLGSHSEATAAILAIFLGGLSLGYWLFGRVTQRYGGSEEGSRPNHRLFLVYGLVEGAIGLYAIVFPWLFGGIQVLSYAVPAGSLLFNFSVDVLLSTLLIGPASVLLGGNDPDSHPGNGAESR